MVEVVRIKPDEQHVSSAHENGCRLGRSPRALHSGVARHASLSTNPPTKQRSPNTEVLLVIIVKCQEKDGLDFISHITRTSQLRKSSLKSNSVTSLTSDRSRRRCPCWLAFICCSMLDRPLTVLVWRDWVLGESVLPVLLWLCTAIWGVRC